MPKQIDIIDLIEKNPITRLSKDYQNELITKIKSKFTNTEQQMFVASFYCFLSYSKNDFVVDLDDIWKWIGFSRKDPAKRLLEKFFVNKVDYKILLHQSVERSNESKKEISKGGHNKEQILMTVNTFKKFCLKANTKKADEIHDYYIKLEELLHETINEETAELRNQLLLKSKEIVEKDSKHKVDIKMTKHNTLIKMMRTKKCVYIGEIKENKYVKIGSSKEVDERTKQLNRDYGDLIFLEIFECDDFRETEENILKDPTIVKNLCKESIKINGKKSKEVIELSSKFTYDQLLTIVKKYIDNSSDIFLTPVQMLEKQKLDLEYKKLDHELLLYILKNDKYSSKVQKIIEEVLPKTLQNISININQNKEQTEPIENRKLDKKETQNPDHAMNLETKVKERSPKGRKLQKIDPDNLETVVKVYDSMVYALRDSENKGFQKSGIQDAIKKNRIYKGFRWNFVEKGEDENVSTVEPTEQSSKPSVINSILQLNDTKTKILDSFYTKDAVAKKLGIGKLKMTKIISDVTKFNDHYYVEYYKCPQKLLNEYNKPINRVIRTHSVQIKQINNITGGEVIFNSFNEIYIKLGFASKTIKDAINNETLLGGSMWEYYEKDKN